MLTESDLSIPLRLRYIKDVTRRNAGCKTTSTAFGVLSVLTLAGAPDSPAEKRWAVENGDGDGLYSLTNSKEDRIFVFVVPAKDQRCPLSPKRQLTLPKELCDRLRARPGDQVEFLEHNGRITILKKARGASAGDLRHLKAETRFSDEESLRDVLASSRAKVTAKRRAA